MKKLFLFLLFSAVVGVITAQPTKTVLITGDTTKFFSYGTKGNTVEFGTTDTSRAAIRLPRVAHPDSIKTPRKGMIVYCTVDSALYLRQNFGWQKVGSGGSVSVDSSIYATRARLSNELNLKQNTLVSGTNIKTLGGHSLLGSGDFEVISPLQTVGGMATQLSINQATTASDGYLSSTDWNTFNNKKNAADSTTASPANYVTQYQRKKTSDSLAAIIASAYTFSGGLIDSAGTKKIMLGTSDFFNDVYLTGRNTNRFYIFSNGLPGTSSHAALKVGDGANFTTKLETLAPGLQNSVSTDVLGTSVTSLGVGKQSYVTLNKGYGFIQNTDSLRLTGGGFTNVGHSLTDTTLNKPVVMSASGRIQKLDYWPSSGVGGGSADSTTFQTNFRTDTMRTRINETFTKNQETHLGVIYNKNSWTSGDLAADFTQSGGITASIVSNKIQVTGGAGTFTQLLKLNGGTYLQHWQMSMKVQLGTINGSAFGYGIGVASSNTYVSNTSSLVRAAFVGSTAALTHSTNASGSYANTFSTSQAMGQTAGDYILITYRVDFPNAYMSLRNMTTGTTQIDTSYIGGGSGNTSNFCIWSLGGTFTIDSLAITSTELKYASDLFIGDSKTHMTSASTVDKSYVGLLRTYSKSIVNIGAGGDRTTDILNRMPEALALKPGRAFLAIGSNDIRSGVSSGTLQTNYANIANQLRTAGVEVIHLLPFYETSIAQLTQRNWILSTFSADSIVDTYTPMTVAGRLNADGIHPNDAGHAAIAAAILQSGKMKEVRPVPPYLYGAVSRSSDSVYQFVNGVKTFAYKDSVGAGGGGGGWGLTGNAGITSGSSYLGTTDTKGLSLRTAGVNRMYFDSTQPYVGIGNTSPNYTLDIKPSAVNAILSLTAPTSSTVAQVRVTNSSNYNGLMVKAGSAYSTYKTTVAHDLYLYNDAGNGNISILNDYASGNINFAAGGASTAHMTIGSTGNVGIGVAPGTEKLKINGTLSINDILYHYSNTSMYMKFYNAGTPYISFTARNNTADFAVSQTGGTGMGTNTPDASLKLDVVTTTQGVRLAPMTRTQANAIASKVAGLEVYSTTDSCKLIWNGSNWQYFAKSGYYTPTLTNTTNIVASTAYACQYSVNGDVVTVSGKVDIDPTAVGAIELRMSLPITSTFTNDGQAGGGAWPQVIQAAIGVSAVSGGATVAFKTETVDISNNTYRFTFTYKIL